MNWGYKIILVYVLFVGGIVFMVVKSSSQKTDLVTADYYDQELKYQHTIDATERANALTAKLQCLVKNDTLNIRFPEEMKSKSVQADIWLYCVADENKDIKKTIETTDGHLQLPLPILNKGVHEVKINWTVAGEHYYFEQKLFLQ
jgi:hypothetical protein